MQANSSISDPYNEHDLKMWHTNTYTHEHVNMSVVIPMGCEGLKTSSQ
jgi:hypothetical protein